MNELKVRDLIPKIKTPSEENYLWLWSSLTRERESEIVSSGTKIKCPFLHFFFLCASLSMKCLSIFTFLADVWARRLNFSDMEENTWLCVGPTGRYPCACETQLSTERTNWWCDPSIVMWSTSLPALTNHVSPRTQSILVDDGQELSWRAVESTRRLSRGCNQLEQPHLLLFYTCIAYAAHPYWFVFSD